MAFDGVASRFAVLKDDDPTDWVSGQKSRKNKGSSTSTTTVKVSGKKAPKGPKNSDIVGRELRAMAFGLSGNNSNTKKGQKEYPMKQQLTQDPEWLRRDEEAVNEAYEKDMEEAILRSKLEFQNEASLRRLQLKEKDRQRLEKEAKKPVKMSLEEFNRLQPDQIDGLRNAGDYRDLTTAETNRQGDSAGDKVEGPEEDLDQLVSSSHDYAKKMLDREKFIESLRHQRKDSSGGTTSSGGNNQAIFNQLRCLVEDQAKEMEELKAKNEMLASDLAGVKKRYKTMRTIVDQAEVKEKAVLVVEVESLRKDKVEMAETIAKLNEELEQNRTKVHELTKELKLLQQAKR